MAEIQRITVRPGAIDETLKGYAHTPSPEAGFKVMIWERHEAHPNGEVYIKQGDEPTEVALTPEVERRLRDGRLVEVK